MKGKHYTETTETTVTAAMLQHSVSKLRLPALFYINILILLFILLYFSLDYCQFCKLVNLLGLKHYI
jgi:hypothetical protein